MDLQTEDFLDGADTGTVLAVVANLMTEVADLRARVAALEAGPDARDIEPADQSRFDDIADRVLSPLTADSELP